MLEKQKIAVKVSGLYKSFKLPHEQHSGLKQLIVNILKRKKGYETQHVLRDVSFEIKKGEFFGIVGRNGSGKSTLLKLLAEIYTPEKGEVSITGSLTPFIELGVGFNPELTGRENVYLNGALLGFDKKQMDDMYDDIVEFAELERFMDQKLKNYSSGMQVRLAFSIAIRSKSDILLIDEVLAVGDSNFQRKCFEYFNSLKNNETTVIFVSHDAAAVQRYCDRALLLEGGKLVKVGKPVDVLDLYLQSNIDREEKKNQKKVLSGEIVGSKAAIIEKISIKNDTGRDSTIFKPRQQITVQVHALAKEDLKNPVVRFVAIPKSGGVAHFGGSTKDTKLHLGLIQKNSRFTVSFSFTNTFHDNDYEVHATIFDKDKRTLLSRATNMAQFSSVGWRANIDIETQYYPPVMTTIQRDE